MKSKKRGLKKDTKKSFVWFSLRISFGLMIMLLVISFFLSSLILNLIFFLSLMFTFIVSIIHLVKYKKKSFAIISLIVSSLILLLYIVGLIVFSKMNALF